MFGNLTLSITLKAFDRMSSVVGKAFNSAIRDSAELSEKLRATSERMAKVGAIAAAGGTALGLAAMKPIEAFSDLESAITSAKVAFSTVDGVDKNFAKVQKIAIQLGNTLPGTHADFFQMAASLKEIGLSSETIANGGLAATAHLRALLGNLDPGQAAELIGTFKESLGVADKDFARFVDTVQRAKFAFGLDPQDFAYSVKYFGAVAKTLGVSGYEATKPLIAMAGELRQAGIDGTVAGTAMQGMFRQLPNIDHAMKKNKELQGIISRYRLHLEFFDKAGKFEGLDNLMRQLDKLRALSQEDRLKAIKDMFGGRGMATIATLVGKGYTGYEQAIQKMAKQASMETRLKMITGTLANTWKAFAGTFQSTEAYFAAGVAPDLKRLINWLNVIAGKLGEWAVHHQRLTRIVGLGTLAVSAFLIVGGTLLGFLATLGFGLAGAVTGMGHLSKAVKVGTTFIKAQTLAVKDLSIGQAFFDAIAYRGGFWKAFQYQLMISKFRLLEGVGALRAWAVAQFVAIRANFLSIAGLKAMGVTLWTSVVGGFTAARAAAWGFITALAANPLTWIALAIAAAALLIWKYWQPLGNFFKGLGQGIMMGLAPLLQTKALQPFLGFLKSAWDWFTKLLKPTKDVGDQWRVAGIYIGEAIGGAIVWVGKFITALSPLLSLIGEVWAGAAKLLHLGTPTLPGAPAGASSGDTAPGAPLLHGARLPGAIAAPAAPFKGGTAAHGSSVVIHYAPTIHLAGATEQDKASFAEKLKENSHHIARIVEKSQVARARTAF